MQRENQNLIHTAVLLAIMFGFTAGFTAVAFADDKPSKQKDQPKAEVTTEDEIIELSVAPKEYPIYPTNRPMWVDAADQVKDNWAKLVIHSVPSISAERSLESLQEQQLISVQAYLDELFTEPGIGTKIGLTNETVEELVDQQRTYDGKLTLEDGEMHEHVSVLVLDENFHKRITCSIQDAQVYDRLVGVGFLGGIAFAGLMGSTLLLRSISPRQS